MAISTIMNEKPHRERQISSLADDSVANSARGVACLGLAGSSLRPGLPAGARWVLSAAWRWPGVGLSAGRAGDAGDAGGSCRRVVTSPLIHMHIDL